MIDLELVVLWVMVVGMVQEAMEAVDVEAGVVVG